MAFAIDTYTATGGQTDFVISFPYLDDDHIVVIQDSVTLTKTTHYTFPNATTMRLVTGATAGDVVEIKRSTSPTTRLVDYTAGPLTETDLDNDSIQGFYMAQESQDRANESMNLNSSLQWDAESKRIESLAEPSASTDAATKSYVDTREGAAYDYEEHTATASQTVFTLTSVTYEVGANNLSVYVAGVRLAPSEYTETSSSVVTLDTGASLNDIVLFVVSDATTTTITDASAVNWNQVGTGYATRNVQAKIRETMSPEDFGAAGDGSTNDVTEFQEAIDALNTIGGGTLDLHGNTYKVNSTLTLYSDITIKNGTIDFSSASTNDTLFEAFGTLATAENLTANATKADTTLTVADSSTFSEHDWLLLSSTGVWDAQDTASKDGELVQVQSESSGTITLRGDIMQSYTTANTGKVQLITQVENITLRNVTILGNDTDDNSLTGMNIAYGRNIVTEGCTFRKLSGSGVSYISCVSSRVSDCFFYDAFDAGSGYGVAISSAVQDCVVSGCNFEYVRHSVSHGVASGYVGIGRRLMITDNTVVNSAKATGGSGGDAIDTHSMSEDVHITNNTITGATLSGINMECKSGVITGNTIVGSAAYGIHYHNESDQSGSVLIAHNRIFRTIGSYAIRCNHGSRGTTTPMRDVTISDNYIETTTDYGIYVNGTSSYDAVQVIVKGNIFRGVATTPIYMQYIDGAVVEGNISNAAVESFMDIRDTHAVSILNNWCRATTSGSYDMLFVQHAEDMQIHGNFLECTGGSGQSAQIYGTLDGVVITSNTMIHSNGSCLWFDPNTPTADKGCTIVGNRVVSATGTGILLSNEADYTAVVGNHARGSSTPINMGSGSNNINQHNIV